MKSQTYTILQYCPKCESPWSYECVVTRLRSGTLDASVTSIERDPCTCTEVNPADRTDEVLRIALREYRDDPRIVA